MFRTSQGFGRSIAALGDVTTDGLPDFAAAERGSTIPGATNAGQVFVVSASNCAILAYLRDPAAVTNGNMGLALAAPGDLTGDGRVDIVALQVRA